MRRSSSLSIAVALVLVAGGATAQSRSVSTADMPRPGVSYISGPSAPVRKETVSTGTLPQPARLYVGGQVSTGGGGYQERSSYGNGSVVDSGFYYGDGYPPGYGYDRGGHGDGHGRPGHGHDHDRPGGGHGGDHDHGPGRNNGSLTLAAPPGGGGHGMATGGGVRLSPDRSNDRPGHGDRGWNQGVYGYPRPAQPGAGMTNSRAPQPGTGMSGGNQPGTGTPMRGGPGGWRGNGR